MAAEKRYFKNPYPDYSSEEAKHILDDDEKNLNEAFLESVNTSVNTLMTHLESQIESSLDWKDTSVYTGTSGYTLLYLHLAEVIDKEIYISRAEVIAEKSLKHLKGKRISFLCGDAGPLALGAVVYDKLEQPADLQFCIDNLIILKETVLDIESGLSDELLYGRVGYLYALLVVKLKVSSYRVDSELIRSVILSIMESGKLLPKQEKQPPPLMYEWHEKKYIGSAHGLTGILVLLLQMRERMTTFEMNDWVRPTIDFVASLVFPSGNMPSSVGSKSDRLIHWCHGAPGAIFLFSLSYKVFKEEKYLNLAKDCADIIWKKGFLKKGYGLCHGAAGNGYGLLFLYQVTKEPKYLYRAAQFGRWCQDYGKHGCNQADRPNSLFEGLAGAIFFLSDLLNVEKAKFPAFIL